MHRAREFFLSWPLLVSTWAAAVSAAPLPSLFAAVVPDADPQRSAQLAMREVLVRLVGSRQAADDPALAGVIGDAKRYVQLERNTTRGATQVIFDGPALRAAVAAAGRSVWDPDRPLVWVVLPALGGAATGDLRAQLNAAAQVRGLPIALVSADSPGAVSPNSANAGSAAVLAAVLAAARRAGAGAALLAQSSPSDPQVLQWTLVAPIAEGHWVGGAVAAIDGATDELVHAARELDGAPLTEFDCRIAGVLDLPGFAAVLGSVSTAPGVSEVTVRAVDADQLTLHLKARGGAAGLARALSGDRLRPTGASGDGALQYRYQAGL
jgi:hypothetical protein